MMKRRRFVHDAHAFHHMARRPLNHIRSHRKRWRLSQHELALLVGFKNPEPISRAERAVGRQALTFALACEVIFDVPVAKLFPGLVAEITEDVLNECEVLHDRIKGKSGAADREKRKMLAKLLGRAEP